MNCSGEKFIFGLGRLLLWSWYFLAYCHLVEKNVIARTLSVRLSGELLHFWTDFHGDGLFDRAWPRDSENSFDLLYLLKKIGLFPISLSRFLTENKPLSSLNRVVECVSLFFFVCPGELFYTSSFWESFLRRISV